MRLSYGLVAMFIISTQQLVYREHPLTHVSIALSASIICAVVMILHDLFRMSVDERTSLSTLVYASLYTTVLSPIVLGVMQKLRRAFGFQSRRLRM